MDELSKKAEEGLGVFKRSHSDQEDFFKTLDQKIKRMVREINQEKKMNEVFGIFNGLSN